MALLQQPIQRKLSALIGAEVTFDKLNLSLLSGTIEALGVTVAGEDRATPVLTIARVKASVAVARALKGEIVVKSLTIERAVVNIVRVGGKTNLPKRIKADEPPAEPAETPPDVVADEKTWKLDAENVLIVDGEIGVQLDDYRVTAKPLLAELKRSGGGAYAVTMLIDAIAIAGAGGAPLSLRANGMISDAADLTAIGKSPATLKVEIGELAKLTLTTPAVSSRDVQVAFEGSFTLARILALLPAAAR